MFLLSLVSAFFCCLILREIFPRRSRSDGGISFGHLAVLATVAVTTAWMPVKYSSFERKMARKVSELTGVQDVSFHCNSAFDSIFDNDINMAGHANPHTRSVVYQLGWCKALMRYLKDPESADAEAKFSLHMFTHEAMHIRGEMVEPRTDCQALQRDVQAAVLLGVPTTVAIDHAREFYATTYQRHPYYTKECGPGKALDESLPHPPW